MVCVALAAVVPYLPAAGGYFLGDDFGLVQLFANKPFLHVFSLLVNPWTESIYGIRPDELRPTLALSYQFDSVWGANNPLGYHASNIALHLLCSLLVFGIARRVANLSLFPSCAVSVLFAVLPIHPETVVWISGRADSIPALFYLSTFLCFALWRRTQRRVFYAVAIGTFILGLYSKQSAITMPVMLVLFDILSERRPPRLRWSWFAAYLPFVGLTVAYLSLRLLLFGNAVREQSLTSSALAEFAVRQAAYVKMLLLGSARIGAGATPPALALLGQLLVWLLIGAIVVFIVRDALAVMRGKGNPWWGRLVFFGGAWWLICIAPLVVTYESPRHLYLPSAGVMVALGIVLERGWSGARAPRIATAAAAIALVVGSAWLLERASGEWRKTAEVSAGINADVARELSEAPPGSLVVIAAPLVGSSPHYHTWLWMWSLPFAAQSPFVPPGATDGVNVLVPPDVFCCPRDQWLAATQQAVDAWASQPDPAPAIVLHWNAYNGFLNRLTDAESPELRDQLAALSTAITPLEACERLNAILGDIEGSCASS